jgi:O-acetyl-ADP-ribose deacetylase (regulator of RNase III)
MVEVELCAIDEELAAAWRAAFKGVVEVKISSGDILSGHADALVSPANSFGYMDGGLDLVYSMKLGWHLEQRVREVLVAQWDGELPVGCAVIVPTDHDRFPWLISAPTMRVPMRVADTAHAFLAFRAILRAVNAHNATEQPPIRTLRCPGLGTGEGRMPPTRCARQMRRAWDVVMCGELVTRGGLAGAVRDHLWLLEQEQDG